MLDRAKHVGGFFGVCEKICRYQDLVSNRRHQEIPLQSPGKKLRNLVKFDLIITNCLKDTALFRSPPPS